MDGKPKTSSRRPSQTNQIHKDFWKSWPNPNQPISVQIMDGSNPCPNLPGRDILMWVVSTLCPVCFSSRLIPLKRDGARSQRPILGSWVGIAYFQYLRLTYSNNKNGFPGRRLLVEFHYNEAVKGANFWTVLSELRNDLKTVAVGHF